MTVRSVVLSGMSLVERTAIDRGGFLAKETDVVDTTLAVFLDGTGLAQDFFTANLGKSAQGMSRNQVLKLVMNLKALGPVYMTVDTYLSLVFQLGLFKPEEVAGVFPWKATEKCLSLPKITPTSDALSRNAALYYWGLHHHQMTDWNGQIRAFPYRASNTLSYRAKTTYHNISRPLRGKICPARPEGVTIQFDWSSAEFSLILQHLGYDPPDDAYGDFVAGGFDRGLTKSIILSHIYGATLETLYKTGGDARSQIDGLLQHLDREYPLVEEWRSQCIGGRLAEFNGFHYDLGDAPHARPNHFAQTALQCCKWELLSRLVCAGVHGLGCGDLHDQLFFDVDPVAERDQIAEVVKQVKMPLFGRYNLRPNLKLSKSWGE